MKIRNMFLNFVMLSSISIAITVATYFVNMWLFSSNLYLREQTNLSPTDPLFFEGVVFLIAGLLLLLGRGGINLWSQRAAILSALGGAIYDEDTVGPAEQFRRDTWRPKGFVRIALILILAGVFTILIYLLSSLTSEEISNFLKYRTFLLKSLTQTPNTLACVFGLELSPSASFCCVHSPQFFLS